MKIVLDIISALTSLGIVGFLIYFFIYYRKPMKSVLDAIGDTDSLKAGPLEFKRRQQDVNKTFAPLMRKIQIESVIAKSQEEIILGLKNTCLLLSGMLLSTLYNMTDSDPHLITRVKGYRDKYYKEVKAERPDSEGIAWCDDMVIEGLLPPIEESQQPKP